MQLRAPPRRLEHPFSRNFASEVVVNYLPQNNMASSGGFVC
jgi:hypothetical protein